jgi:hypothetical protein
LLIAVIFLWSLLRGRAAAMPRRPHASRSMSRIA